MDLENASLQSQNSKNKERITVNFRKYPLISIEEAFSFLEKINQKPLGEAILWPHVLAYFIKNHSPEDIIKLQEASMSLMDKVRLKFERDKEKKKIEENLTFEEYLAQIAKVH